MQKMRPSGSGNGEGGGSSANGSNSTRPPSYSIEQGTHSTDPLPSPSTAAAASALFHVNHTPSSTSHTSSGSFSYYDRARMGMETNDAVDEDGDEDDENEESVDDEGDDLGNEQKQQVMATRGDTNTVHNSGSNNQQQQNATGGVTHSGSSTSTTLSTNPEPVRKRNVGVPKFLRFLFQMLELEDRMIISWSHKGTAFQIRQPEELAERVLPKYFKHNKVSSFQRQLNYFGFKKWTKTQTNICTFSHPCFVRGEKEKMKLIKRKERVNPGSTSTKTTAAKMTASALTTTTSTGPSLPGVVKQAPLKRQKSATSTAFSPVGGSSEMFMRRHSTGTLPYADVIAAGGLQPRKRSGTMDEEPTRTTTDPKEPALRQPARLRGKRKSLPDVMTPNFCDRRSDFGMSEFASSETKPLSAMASGFGHFLSTPSISVSASSSMKADASPVVPISAEGLMQNTFSHRHPSYSNHPVPAATVYPGGGNDPSAIKHDVAHSAMDMSGLSGPLQGSPSWTSGNHYPAAMGVGKDPNIMLMMPYKYGELNSNNGASVHMSSFDGMPIMEYSNQAHKGNQQNNQQTHHNAGSYHQQHHHQHQQPPKDYIDVLLESAALDDHMSNQEPPLPASSAGSWETNYTHPPSNQEPISQYEMIQGHSRPPHQSHHQHSLHSLQMPANVQDLHGINNNQGQRF